MDLREFHIPGYLSLCVTVCTQYRECNPKGQISQSVLVGRIEIRIRLFSRQSDFEREVSEYMSEWRWGSIFVLAQRRSNIEVLGSERLILSMADGERSCRLGSWHVLVVFGMYAATTDKILTCLRAAASNFLDCEIIEDG